MTAQDDQIFQRLAAVDAAGVGCALCTIVSSEGSTPRRLGSKMLVYPDGQLVGTIGGGEMESRVAQAALAALASGRPEMVRYSLVDPARGDPGVCGGTVEVFVDPVLPRPTLVVVGAGHVGQAVAHLAGWLGFRVVVSDDRPEFCTPEAAPGAELYLNVPLAELPAALPITPYTYLVLTTRSAQVDIAGLPALLATPAAFIGVIGSRRRWAATAAQLRAAGISEDALARVVSPIGVEIHAETPEEIAVSILGQVIALRRGG